MDQYLPRTFSCLCGHSHKLVDDNDVWVDKDGHVIGQTKCLLAAKVITEVMARK